jgi:ligand-binding SRPBCC domain-containing protein
MSVFQIDREQIIPHRRAQVFAFFMDAANLETMTPPWLRFRILTPAPIVMRAGTRIDYMLRLHGIPVRWTSAITVWEPPLRFVDEQVRGPYRVWVHEHRFEEAPAGTRVIDSIRYAVPGGALVNRWLVAPDLRRVFDFRREKLSEVFAVAESS